MYRFHVARAACAQHSTRAALRKKTYIKSKQKEGKGRGGEGRGREGSGGNGRDEKGKENKNKGIPAALANLG